MRPLLFALAILAASVGTSSRAAAQDYPWCAIYAMDGAPRLCTFVSFEQCMQTVRGAGGFCVVNNLYQPGGRRR